MARYALVIGIAQYQSSNLKPLSKAATDAEVVARVLEEHGEYTVTRLPHRWNAETQRFEVAPQKSVSADEVCEALQTLLLEQGTKSDVLIYFAGHGLTFFDNLGEQKGALATSDCQVEMVGRQVVNYKHGIDLSSLNRLIKKSDLSSLVMLLDCCHSGYFLESQLVQQTLTAFSTQKDYYLITACRSFETVKALAGEAHAIFTGALLKGLASENASRNGQVSGDRLFDYISNELKGTQWGQEAIRMGWGRCITLVTYPQLETSATEITFDRQNPYLGLSAFGAEQEKYFCGRDEAVRTLITHLTNSRFLSVIGYSGSGKSSLIKAGLLPDLSRDRIPGSSQWPVESFTPGKHPLGKLVDILARHREQNQLFVIFIDQFEEVFTLCEDEAERQGFIRLIAQEMKDTERKSRMIIALRGDFLIRCANYPEVLNLINHIPTTTYIVKSLGIEELPEAIEKPAELHGVKFERGLVSQVAQDVAGQAGTLPLLQYALKELWRVCIEKPESPEPLLTKKGYEEIGGVQGALENRANVIYQSLSEGDRIFVRKLFMELVQLGEGNEVTRRRVDWDRLRAIADSPEQLDRVIGVLAGAQQRLIIVDENTVEVAHEALLCRWKLLSDWIEEDQENIRISRRLEIACREWEETYRKSDDALLTGARLAEVEEWEKRVQPNWTGDEREFLRKSVGRRDREIQAQLEQERQLRELAEANAKVEAARAEEERAKTIAQMERALAAEDKANAETARVKEAEARVRVQKHRTRLAIASGILLTFTLGLGLLTNVLAGQKREQEVSKVSLLIGRAQQLLEKNLQLDALIASVEALKEMKKQRREDPKELQQIQSVIFKVHERNQLKAHPGGVYSVNFSPDGTMIASGGVDKKIIIWSQAGKMLFSPNERHKDKIWSVRFSPDSKFIASASIDGTINIWSNKGQLIHSLKGHTNNIVYDVSFSEKSERIYSSSQDGTIRIWDVKTGRSLETFPTPNSLNKSEYKIRGLDLQPFKNSVLVYTGNKDYEFSLWDMKNPGKKGIKTIGNTQSVVMSVRFNKNGNMIVSSQNKNGNGTIKIWDITGNLIGLIDSPKDGILYAEFSHDSKYIASASSDNTIKIWKVDEVLNKNQWKNNKIGLAQPLTILAGHTEAVNRVSFNPLNSESIASASDDGTVRIWEISGNKRKIKKRYNLDELLTQSCNFLSDYSNMCKNLN
ncbi:MULTISPECIES: nSTAND1 domain-containing NTPase [unclassified Microcoleus]|uniref:nSTAND1 domain-containing NTPase n=1 Tax=unclassified Microcoleus TaxID=2642155 RepID=UPI002FD029E7